MECNFLVSVIPAQNAVAVAQCLNWIHLQGFEVSALIPVMIPAPQQGLLVQKANNRMTVSPMLFVYAATSEWQFKNYFDFDYDSGKLEKIPEAIAKKEGAPFGK